MRVSYGRSDLEPALDETEKTCLARTESQKADRPQFQSHQNEYSHPLKLKGQRALSQNVSSKMNDRKHRIDAGSLGMV